MRRLEEQAKREAAEELTRRAEAEAERQRTGEKRRGRVPKPVDDSPADKAQMSFTDADLHIMKTNNKGWDYCGNAQASVDGACQIILACEVTAETNDRKQAEPMGQATLETVTQAALNRTTKHLYTTHPVIPIRVILNGVKNLTVETLRCAQGDKASVPISCGLI